MLNELLIAERGLARAGVSMTPINSEIKIVGRKPMLAIGLAANGSISSVRAIPSEAEVWTLGDNQKAFPLLRGNRPALWNVAESHPIRAMITGRKAVARRDALIELHENVAIDPEAGQIGGDSFFRWLERKSAIFSAATNSPLAHQVAEAMKRLTHAAGPSADRALFAKALSTAVVDALRHSADEKLTAFSAGLLLGKYDIKKGKAVAETGLLFEVALDSRSDDAVPIWHRDVVTAVSNAMATDTSSPSDASKGAVCALRGVPGSLLSGPFPNPNLPALGPTVLFSRFPATPSLARYGRFEQAMPVACSTAESLQAAAVALTLPERENKTWRSIPGEREKQTDLMLAYVAVAPDAPATEVITSERDLEELSRELVDLVRTKVGEAGLSQTPVRLTVLRRVDRGNCKALVSDTVSVTKLQRAACDWQAARRLLPPGFTLPLPEKKKWIDVGAPNVAPLALISFTRAVFIRGGTERTDAVGITAAEALALFLADSRGAAVKARRILHLVLQRRTALIAGCAHALHRGFDDLSKFDRLETLRTVTVLCVLLHKLGLHKGDAMSDDPGFKLGQLLTAADAVHAGYCADVRGGHLPPSLLGNQVFATAQKSPIVALNMLSRRWKPYGAWVKPYGNIRERANKLLASKEKTDQRRGWDILVALRHARDWKPLSADLAQVLQGIQADDVYRAQLLLGYIAGLPKRASDEGTDDANQINEGNRQ